MTVSIPLLRRDHINFSLILNALERQLDGLSAGQPLSHQLFKLAARYFRNYPRKVHHPKEDLIYGALIHRSPHDTSRLFHVLQDHRELAEFLAGFENAIDAYDAADQASTARLCDVAREFIRREREHMEMEEGHLYPVAVHQLSESDWLDIDARFDGEADTAFDDDTLAAYDRLIAEVLLRDGVARGLHKV